MHKLCMTCRLCSMIINYAYICVCVCVCVYMQDQHIEMSTSIIIIMLKHRSVTRHMHEYDACTSLKAGVAKHSLGTVVVISRMGDCLLNPIYSAEQWTIKEWRQMHSGTRQMGEGISFSADFTRPLIGGGLQPTDQRTLDRVTATKLIDHLHST